MTGRIEQLAEGVTLKRDRAKESTRRYRLRLKGEDVPYEPLGPKPGFRQSPEHVGKRKRNGDQHYAWQGDRTSVRNGRKRALRLYPEIEPCKGCGSQWAERHHVDGDTSNNQPSNIQFLCRRCHMDLDGRLARFRNVSP